ncbi:MAG: glycosyltransferase [Lachnospiraceae bacterium]|nr:glycosyltransferase [Lachnospiraceae bacterium]
MKKILFAINTLGRAGAEVALLELIRSIDEKEYEIYLYVVMGQGEVIREIPDYVKVLNSSFDAISVLSAQGKKQMKKNVRKLMFRNGSIFKNFIYVLDNGLRMIFKGKIAKDKLLWKVLSDGGEFFDEEFDLAVAYLEGGSTYYVRDHVKAKKKVAFVHVDYSMAGYNRRLDKNVYLDYDKIFTVSSEVADSFTKVYEELQSRTEVFNNIINKQYILDKSKENYGFTDDFDGVRLLTVGRLTAQKALQVSVEACNLLKKRGANIRWYVLGEGDQRKKLEKLIRKKKLEKDFILCGAVENPYTYMLNCDIIVHESRYEGKSIAIQEAQILGKPIIVSDCNGNREQVIHDIDGIMCGFDSLELCKSIERLIVDNELRDRIGEKAREKNTQTDETCKMLELIE